MGWTEAWDHVGRYRALKILVTSIKIGGGYTGVPFYCDSLYFKNIINTFLYSQYLIETTFILA